MGVKTSRGKNEIIKSRSNISNKKKQEVVYKTIFASIDAESYETYIDYIQKIDFSFCAKFQIGPYFLGEVPELFFGNEKCSKSHLKVLQNLLKVTEYKKYNNSNKINYEIFFKSKSLYCLSKISNLKESIFYCPSMAFRLPLYCIALFKEDFIEKNYSNKHQIIQNGEKVMNQIELDIVRTAFKYKVLNEQPFITNFRSVLFEIACRDENLSYVQGMNFIVAFILLFTGNNIELTLIFFFRILSMKSKYFNAPFRDCYSSDFPLLRNYLILFKDVLYKNEEELYNQLTLLDIDGFYWVAKWIQTLFALNFKYELSMKFWDIFISEGLDSIIIISISVLTFFKKEILKCRCVEEFLLTIQKVNVLSKKEYCSLFSLVINNIKNKKYII